MTHPTNETIELYSRGRLDSNRKNTVEQHLRACELCRRRIHAELTFVSAVRQAVFCVGQNVSEGQDVARAPT